MKTVKPTHPAMERLYSAFIEAGLIDSERRQSALARLLNTNSQSVKNWEERGPSKDVRLDVQERFGINATWVDVEKGYPFLQGQEPESYHVKMLTAHKNAKSDNLVIVKQFEAGGSMGDAGVILQDQPGQIESWTVTREWIQKNIRNCTASENLCIVTGFGDSMRPLYEPGDPLIIDTGVRSVDFDGIYFFRVGDEGFIKRLQRIPGEGIMAISENKAYRDWVIREGMDFEVLGRVIKAWKSANY